MTDIQDEIAKDKKQTIEYSNERIYIFYLINYIWWTYGG